MKKQLILINMGSPNSLAENKIFLQRMFNDRCILPLHAIARKILATYIAQISYKKSWQKYENVGGSPLAKEMQNLLLFLQPRLPSYDISIAYSYSKPFIQEHIKELLKSNSPENLYFLVLYPHFSLCTSQSVIYDIEKVMPIKPQQIISHLTFNDQFAKAFAIAIKNGCDLSQNPKIIFTAHSIPQRLIAKGDPYQNQIEAFCQIVATTLDLKYEIGYQSQTKRGQWLTPTTESLILQQNANILLIPISFICENLETLNDLDLQLLPMAKNHHITANRFFFPPIDQFIGPILIELLNSYFNNPKGN
ncbi:MAG: ferrochelatase [Lentisphaeria bacterium]